MRGHMKTLFALLAGLLLTATAHAAADTRCFEMRVYYAAEGKLDALHARWAMLLRSLTEEQFVRPLVHPASGAKNIDWLLSVYSWHGAHHTAHITELRKAKGW